MSGFGLLIIVSIRVLELTGPEGYYKLPNESPVDGFSKASGVSSIPKVSAFREAKPVE
jgi:hypothetical protein